MVTAIPPHELSIIWRYFDGVSLALARRFVGGSSPGEENLTFLLCELLDEGTTALHMLDYPLSRAKADLARADGGITLDVSFQTHEHSKYIESKYSGADLGLVFVADHPLLGRRESAVLLQAKRLFPFGDAFKVRSAFTSFHHGQLNFLNAVASRFGAEDSVFYLWYSPSSDAFVEPDANVIRALEAHLGAEVGRMLVYRDGKALGAMVARSAEQHWPPKTTGVEDEAREQSWRAAQPATRISALPVVSELVKGGVVPTLEALYRRRLSEPIRHLSKLIFDPLAELLTLGLCGNGIGNSSGDWLRLARGERVVEPSDQPSTDNAEDEPRVIPPPRHSITFTLRSALDWPEGSSTRQDRPRG